MPDEESKPGSDDGWADIDRYEVDITLPDGSKVTQSTSPTGEGPVESSLTDSEGNPVRSWDSDSDLTGDIDSAEPPDEYPPNEMSGDELQRWFDDRVVDTPEFKNSATALNKWGPSGWGKDDIRWTAHVLDFNDRLQCGLEDLGRVADPLLTPAVVSGGRLDKDVDWSFAFGRLSLGAQREFHDGWTHQYPRRLDGPTWFGAKAMEWFRRSPVMSTVILVFGTAVIVVPVILFSLDDDPGRGEADFGELSEDNTTETEPAPPAETETEPETEPPADEQAFAPIPSGTTEITGLIDSACGGLYTVFLRAMAFNNQQTTVDQLDIAGGNPFQTASGWGDGRISIVTGGDTSFYEVWFFLWNLGEILSVYNVYGTSADFTAPESAQDVARFESVLSPEDLLAAVNGSPDSCAAEMTIESADFSAFPEANS